MYVCICNAIREQDFRRAALQTHGDAEDVYATLNARPQCGSCLTEAQMILHEERQSGEPGRLKAA